MELSLLNSILIILTMSIVVNALCQWLKMPVIIGYILVGIFVGQHAIGIISESETIKLLAEFGIVFLMFTVGLEFSLHHLLRLKKEVFGFGGLQVVLTILVTLGIGFALKMSKTESLIVGFIVAMSSTAIVLKQLTEQLEINEPYAQKSLGILLFQDLAVIPILILMPSISDLNTSAFIAELFFSLIKASLAIIAILLIGKRLLRPLLYSITNAYSLEMFTLTILFISLGAAWLTSFLGLSLALGAFLAGMMLGETEFKHQIKTDIRPFKDVLLGFFFITIGMQFNASIMLTAWHWMLLVLLALIVFKILLITFLGIFFTRSAKLATQTALILAQGGEFGFAILTVALSHHLLPQDYGQVILGALLCSMALAPIIIKHHQSIVNMLFKHTTKTQDLAQTNIAHVSEHLKNHIILCGYGRVGQNIARFLEKAKIKFIAFDLDPLRVKTARLAGDNVCYGDASTYEILKLAKVDQARAVIISFINTHAAINILEQTRKHHQDLPLIVRSHDDSQTKLFLEKGATEVIPEILEASLMISSHILLLMNVHPTEVYRWIDESRQNRYNLLRFVFPGRESLSLEEIDYAKEALNVVTLTQDAYAVGKSISELSLDKHQVKITAIRRGSHRFVDPPSHMTLQEGDNIVLYGSQPNLEHVEEFLLVGEK
jgi:CPA2 family monovalent cation:H+ antiporter-2